MLVRVGWVIERIDDAGDPRVADYRNVKEAELFRTRGVFVAEGIEVVRTLIERSYLPVRSVFVAEHLFARLPAVERSVPVYVAPKSVLSDVAGFDLHRGCLALGERGALLSLPSVLEAAARSKTVLVVEAIANHDNVGAVFRNARGFGVGAIFLDPRTADPLYRKAIRVSMGATLTVPFARMGDWPKDLSKLEAGGFSLAALTPRNDAVDLCELFEGSIDPPPSKIALLLGTEGEGLSREVLERAHQRWKISMAEGADSLNVAVASAIALFALEASARSRPR